MPAREALRHGAIADVRCVGTKSREDTLSRPLNGYGSRFGAFQREARRRADAEVRQAQKALAPLHSLRRQRQSQGFAGQLPPTCESAAATRLTSPSGVNGFWIMTPSKPTAPCRRRSSAE
jgi:hypothetical protein